MNHFLELWAPCAKKVELVIRQDRDEMLPDPRREAWWRSSNTYPAGTRYGYVIDGRGPFPDPRSPSQPDGVHGLSCVVDHTQFAWSDQGWQQGAWSSAVIYELHIGTFSDEGTFEGAIAHLKKLVDLGVTHVELMPVCEFPGERGWGYDGTSLYAPHHTYGGVSGLKSFVNYSHSIGLAVILDVVYNHLGPDGNYLPEFGPYFSARHMTPWGEGPNLDGEQCSQVRQFFIDNALMWLRDYHIDGLRLDAIDKIRDDSPQHLLVQLRRAVDDLEKETGTRRILIAESASNERLYVTRPEDGGYGMDAQWNDDFHHALRTVFTGESETYYMDFGSLNDLAKAIRQGFVYDGVYSKFRGKVHGTSAAGLPAESFLAYLQTHDQVGNRAQGDRFHHDPAVKLIHQKIAAALVLLSPYTPMIFMGEEWAASTPFLYFTDHHNEQLGKAVSEGRRNEFGGSQWQGEVPDPQSLPTFIRSKLRWNEREREPHRQMLDWYAELLSLRHSHPDFGPGSSVEVLTDAEETWLCMRRGSHRVLAKFKEGAARIPLPQPVLIVIFAGARPIHEDSQIWIEGPSLIVTREE
jgi:maltooligosyltrehalose trehalohydrolase